MFVLKKFGQKVVRDTGFEIASNSVKICSNQDIIKEWICLCPVLDILCHEMVQKNFGVLVDDGKTPPPKNSIVRYGYIYPPKTADWTIELHAFRSIAKDGTPREENFRRAAKMFFHDNFVWHPWANAMLEECCYSKFVGFAGCGSSGKSDFMAVWVLLNWMAAPFSTLGLLTSTSIRDSKKRVWGAVQRYWPALAPIAPAKLTDTPTPAIYVVKDKVRMEQAGIYLIPAEAKKSNEVTGKMRGMKAPRVFLAADELSELSHSLLDTALSNLSNNAVLHICAAANPVSYYDPFGKFVEPKDGWNSITVNDDRWETKLGGVALHFDAMRNPNYIARKNVWPIQKWEKIEEAVERLGEDSPMFWRDFRGFWPPGGISKAIYSEQEIIKGGADKAPVWQGSKTRVAGVDPSFVSGGDRCVLYLGSFGPNRDGVDQVSFDTFHFIEDDASSKEPRTFQVAQKIATILRQEGVDARYLGVDVTGGGVPFCDALSRVLGTNDFLRVHFGGSPSDRPLSPYDPTPANEKYTNRVTELWFGAKEYLQNGQLRGVGPDLAQEMTARNYDTRKSGGMKLCVEPKTDMKSRMGRSPDVADAAFVLLEAVRERLGLRPPQEGGARRGKSPWRSAMRRFDVKNTPCLLEV